MENGYDIIKVWKRLKIEVILKKVGKSGQK